MSSINGISELLVDRLRRAAPRLSDPEPVADRIQAQRQAERFGAAESIDDVRATEAARDESEATGANQSVPPPEQASTGAILTRTPAGVQVQFFTGTQLDVLV